MTEYIIATGANMHTAEILGSYKNLKSARAALKKHPMNKSGRKEYKIFYARDSLSSGFRIYTRIM